MVKTWELTGRALDYAVATIELAQHPSELVPREFCVMWSVDGWLHYSGEPDHESGDGTGAAGDAIIDREKISVLIHHSGVWLAYLGFNHNDDRKFMTSGPTRREAAMRCWARSKLGDEIDIPKEITE